ncbi:MAG TPA: YdeI/OmpD-associated family protein [Gemmatimonadaceae bacterium]
MEVNRKRLRFFRSGKHFRQWLEKNHAAFDELWVGFYRKDSGKGGITYPEALDEALCYGWIDGIRKKLDDVSFTTRFTPRKPNSIWSNVNVGHVARLTREGRMMPPGIAAYERKTPVRTGVYSFENTPELDADTKTRFMKNSKAWKYFNAQAPYYRRVATWYVVSAKRPGTRASRLTQLIEHCARGERLPQFIPSRKTSTK